jgi:hypothetical protein
VGLAALLKDTFQGVVMGERSDGERIKNLHPYRRLMAHIMPGRNESVVYYDTYARVDTLLQYLEEVNEYFHVDITHCLVAACNLALWENPKMNRFITGRRLYQRNGRSFTFSMKRKKLGREAKLSAVKLAMDDGETFRELVARINGNIKVERSSKKTHADKEFAVLDRLPRSVLDLAVSGLKRLDHWSLLPKSFIKNDAMYTSIFIANLGSVGMSPGYHHLYEWGNCPLFMMVGKIEERALVVDGEITVQKVLPIRWSYDERIDDGLNAGYGIATANRLLENPYTGLGCLSETPETDQPLVGPSGQPEDTRSGQKGSKAA